MVFFAKLRELLDDKKQLTEAIFLMPVDLNQKLPVATYYEKCSDHQKAYPTQSDALAIIKSLRERVAVALFPIAGDTQTLLDDLADVRYESFEENQQIVSELQKLLNQLGLRVRRVSDPGQQPSILRCYQDGRGKKTGRFQFEHFQDGKKKRSSSTIAFPYLQLVQPKEDQRLKKRDKS